MLNGQGFVLTNRKALVLGSLGAIGIQTMKTLSYRLGDSNLAGVDLKYDDNQNYSGEQVTAPRQEKKDSPRICWHLIMPSTWMEIFYKWVGIYGPQPG